MPDIMEKFDVYFPLTIIAKLAENNNILSITKVLSNPALFWFEYDHQLDLYWNTKYH